jgi:hypothetical protein
MVADNLKEKGTGLIKGVAFLNSSKAPFIGFCLKKEHHVDPEHL